MCCGRTPQGVRGLKPSEHIGMFSGAVSRTPQGVRGLKPAELYEKCLSASRTPQGVRGLKPTGACESLLTYSSHSARSAWIETAKTI